MPDRITRADVVPESLEDDCDGAFNAPANPRHTEADELWRDSTPHKSTMVPGSQTNRTRRVAVISLGGTIVMASSSDSGLIPSMSAQELIASVPRLQAVAEISTIQSRLLPGPHLTLDDVFALIPIIRDLAANVDGVVLTQGTDTIEEVAFALDVLLDVPIPVVVTGAMRPPGFPGADGPGNLLASAQVAASAAFRDVGVLVVFNDEIHAAGQVRKVHPSSLNAFASLMGPIGIVSEGHPKLLMRPLDHSSLPIPPLGRSPYVPILSVGIGDDGSTLRALQEGTCDGLVIEGMGGGHVPPAMVAGLERFGKVAPVVLASRTRAGEVLRGTYGFPGSETDLIRRGAIPAGILDAFKARVLLILLLMSDSSYDTIKREFARWSS